MLDPPITGQGAFGCVWYEACWLRLQAAPGNAESVLSPNKWADLKYFNRVNKLRRERYNLTILTRRPAAQPRSLVLDGASWENDIRRMLRRRMLS